MIYGLSPGGGWDVIVGPLTPYRDGPWLAVTAKTSSDVFPRSHGD